MPVNQLFENYEFYGVELRKKAYKEDSTLKAAAIDLGYLTSDEFDQWVRPENMIG